MDMDRHIEEMEAEEDDAEQGSIEPRKKKKKENKSIYNDKRLKKQKKVNVHVHEKHVHSTLTKQENSAHSLPTPHTVSHHIYITYTSHTQVVLLYLLCLVH